MKRIATLAMLMLASVPCPAPAQTKVSDLYRRSYSLEARNDVAGALTAMEEIAASGAVDYVFYLRKGWLQYLAGQHASSAAAYGRAVELEPKAVEPKLGLMLPLMAQQRWAEAEHVGQQVLGMAPGDFTAQSRIAFIQYSQGRYAEAEGSYRKALGGFPSNVEMRAGLGWSLLKQGKAFDARAEFDRILLIAPDHASAKEGLAASTRSAKTQ
jgi:tetratricopeptide (TPR) repeat protein